MIPSLVQAQQLNEDQTQELRDIVAWRLMGSDVTEEQAIWRDDAIMRSQSTPLVERRVRMALGTGDRHGLNTWLARLPMEAKEKDEWRYWQADLLLERGRDEEAQAILRSLMQQRGFYPMVAAQRLGEEYTFRIDKASGTIDPALASGPEMARVRELMYWNMDNTARTEWANLVTSRTKSQQAQLARYAFDQHWWDLSVQATIAGKLWDQLEERFPLAYNDLFARYVSGKGYSAELRDGDCPSGERLEPESALAGRRQRTDADYAGHRDAYRQYVQHSRLQRPVAAVGSGNQHQHRHQLSAVRLSAVRQ